jgi:hypothetical protein
MCIASCRGTLSTVQEIVKAGGIRALWQGTGPSVLRVGLGAALQFVVLEQVKTLLSVQLADGTSQLSAMGAAISGGMGVVSWPAEALQSYTHRDSANSALCWFERRFLACSRDSCIVPHHSREDSHGVCNQRPSCPSLQVRCCCSAHSHRMAGGLGSVILSSRDEGPGEWRGVAEGTHCR